jgi:hypothetical protein
MFYIEIIFKIHHPKEKKMSQNVFSIFVQGKKEYRAVLDGIRDSTPRRMTIAEYYWLNSGESIFLNEKKELLLIKKSNLH